MQLEHYFGDYNLPRDKFILDLMKQNSGWISMDTMLTFPRLAALTKDPLFIMDALLQVGNGLMQVDKANKRIRRDPRHPLPENTPERRLQIRGRTVLVRGLPRDDSVRLDDLIDFFENNFDDVVNMRMCVKKNEDGKPIEVIKPLKKALEAKQP